MDHGPRIHESWRNSDGEHSFVTGQLMTEPREDLSSVDLTSREQSGVLRRRHLLFGGAAAGVGAIAAVGASQVASADKNASATDSSVDEGANGNSVVPFYGDRQAGVTTAAQAHGLFVALDLNVGTSKERLRALLKLLSYDPANLTQGKAALADTEAELALRPANLTVTFGFAPRILNLVASEKAPSCLEGFGSFFYRQARPGIV